MIIEQQYFSYEVYESIGELKDKDAALLHSARQITGQAYAPYSKFNVGAAAQLNNGKVITGTNQENASFPVGLCAERALLATAASLFPKIPIETMAISYHNTQGESNQPISPCGMCRQFLVEYESRVSQPMRIILSGLEGKVFIIENAGMLLPLSFSAEAMG